MLRYKNVRDGDTLTLVDRELSLDKLIADVVQYELGFGATVIDVTATQVELKTRIFNSVDHITVSGPEREIEPLAKLCALYAGVRHYESKRLVEAATGAVLQQNLPTTPFMLQMAGGFLIGGGAAKAACVLYLAGEDKRAAETLIDIKLKDLITFVQLKAAGATLEEILAANA
jgi:hypothetical protein